MVKSFDQDLIRQNFENALIQKNNIRWIKQKVLEGGEPPKAEARLETLKFVGGNYWEPILPRRQLPLIDLIDRGLMLDSVDTSHNSFEIIAELLRNHVDLLNDLPETPSECYSCNNYSHSPYLKCAVNPARKIDQECYQFESSVLDWDSSEDNPANYSDWDSSEDNPENYLEN